MLVGKELSVSLPERTLVERFDVELPASSVLALCGPSGSGKTTLLRAIAHLHPLAAGKLTFDGRTVDEIGACAWRRQVAYVAQQPPALESSAEFFFDEVSAIAVHGPGEANSRRQRARSIASRWGMRDSHWVQRFADLSGGERQRLYLAIVLSTQPRVLLLDEPTSALDADTRSLVEEDLKAYSAIWVTHDRAQARRVAREIREIGS